MALSSFHPHELPPPGRWPRALAGDAEASRELAERYWYAVYLWWRRSGREDAGTLTQACFARWLREAPPRAGQPGAERLREWLLAQLRGLTEIEPVAEPATEIKPEWAEERYAEEPAGSADEVFQRRWALTVLEFAMMALRAEYATRGQEALFEAVAPYASFEGGDDERYASTASRLKLSVGGARKAVYDFRSRHQELLRGIVIDTVADPGEINSELTALLIACDAAGGNAPLPSALQSFKPDELLARAMRSVKMTSGGGGIWTPPTDAEAAALFPQYEMLGILGRGGMGAVYKARKVSLDRFVAIKLLPLEISVDKDFADRFRREARAMARLNHPNIISVYDFGETSEGHLYFTMQFVEGPMLHTLIHGEKGDDTGERLPPDVALELVEQVCDALAYAHELGIIHRDIKPANVMVDARSRVKVADFGLARMAEADPAQWGSTMTGVVMGTPDYMAPEQKRGLHVDQRADLYALGVLLYEALCQETPQGVFEMPSQRCGLDKRLDTIITKAMANQPEARYQNATEMKTAIATVRPAVAKAQAKKTPAFRVAAAPIAMSLPGRTSARAASKSKVPLLVGGVAIVAALALVGARFLRKGAEPEPLDAPLAVGSGPQVEAWVDALTEDSQFNTPKPEFETTKEGVFLTKPRRYVFGKGAVVDGAVRVVFRYTDLTALPRPICRIDESDWYLPQLYADRIGIKWKRGGQYVEIATGPLKKETFQPGQDVALELRMTGNKVTVKVNDKTIVEAESDELTPGALGLWYNHNQPTLVKKVEYLVLDPDPPRLRATPATATRKAPFVNSLSMKFVPVPITGGPTNGQRVLFNMFETRTQDYEAFIAETKRTWEKPTFEQGFGHPAVNMTWDDAKAFCDWLTNRERKSGKLAANESYRLPTDHEWSCAVGIGASEDPNQTPEQKNQSGSRAQFPWGTAWPPPVSTGNYSGEETVGQEFNQWQKQLAGYRDPYVFSSPVGSFIPNAFGIFDLSGNAQEFCEDWADSARTSHVVRGGDFTGNTNEHLRSSYRFGEVSPLGHRLSTGFRVVLAATTRATAPVAAPPPPPVSAGGGPPMGKVRLGNSTDEIVKEGGSWQSAKAATTSR